MQLWFQSASRSAVYLSAPNPGRGTAARNPLSLLVPHVGGPRSYTINSTKTCTRQSLIVCRVSVALVWVSTYCPTKRCMPHQKNAVTHLQCTVFELPRRGMLLYVIPSHLRLSERLPRADHLELQAMSWFSISLWAIMPLNETARKQHARR